MKEDKLGLLAHYRRAMNSVDAFIVEDKTKDILHELDKTT